MMRRKPTFTMEEITYAFLAASTVDPETFVNPAIKAVLYKIKSYAIEDGTSVEFPNWRAVQ